MTTKRYIPFILIGLVVFFMVFTYKNMYVEYDPIIYENDYYKKVKVNNAFYKNLLIVLDYNNVNYKIDEQQNVLIKRSLSEDKELLSNYTKKALDTIWLNSHMRSK